MDAILTVALRCVQIGQSCRLGQPSGVSAAVVFDVIHVVISAIVQIVPEISTEIDRRPVNDAVWSAWILCLTADTHAGSTTVDDNGSSRCTEVRIAQIYSLVAIDWLGFVGLGVGVGVVVSI